ncbi:MAG: ectoine/hydroxyectoine transporter permease subunit EhuC [Blastococcus sp.]|jgi:polar amino acid transport system permease protein|nr:ectoine/hydroxyectoine transporter permease subunit EhuC [Blastococcus sp.]
MLEEYLPYLAKGLLVTVEVTILAMLVALPMAFVLGIGRLSAHAPVRWVSGAVVEFFRGTSALVQLFLAYYVLPHFGIWLPALLTAVLVLGLNEASYASEIVRGAIKAIPRGQREASVVLGMTTWVQYRRVLLPQAVPAMLPSFGNILIDMIKFSSLVALVTVPDLTFSALQVRQTIGESAQVFGLILICYFALSVIGSRLSLLLERRVARSDVPSRPKKALAAPSI